MQDVSHLLFLNGGFNVCFNPQTSLTNSLQISARSLRRLVGRVMMNRQDAVEETLSCRTEDRNQGVTSSGSGLLGLVAVSLL